MKSNASSSAVENRSPVVLLTGPTAVGKSSLALKLARCYPSEIVSVDSRQLYRMMDIGTAKPSIEERTDVPHHLLDLVNPDIPFTAADFVKLARASIVGIQTRDRLPILVGGTGLYWKLLLDGMVDAPGPQPDIRQRLATEERNAPGTLFRRLLDIDPDSARVIQEGNLVRIVRALEVYEVTGRSFSSLQRSHRFSERSYRALRIGLFCERERLYEKIDARVEEMFRSGLVEEVHFLLRAGYNLSHKAMRSIGYQEVVSFLRGDLSESEAAATIKRNSRNYAKRQLSWLRRDKSMIWLDSLRESDRISALIDDFIE